MEAASPQYANRTVRFALLKYIDRSNLGESQREHANHTIHTYTRIPVNVTVGLDDF